MSHHFLNSNFDLFVIKIEHKGQAEWKKKKRSYIWSTNVLYLSHVRKYGGVEIRLMVYIEYLIISVIVQANNKRGKPTESCEGGNM